MSYHKNQKGFTLSELIVVIMISSFLLITVYLFTMSSVSSFMRMQAEGLAQSKLTEGSFRITRVIRGVNYIESADADTITAYSYFAPQDTYTSKIRYYLNGTKDKMLADVTPMTADYPIGTLITAQKKTVVIIDKFYKVPSKPTFTYYDANYTTLTTPVTDVQTIKNISVQLHIKKYNSSATAYVSDKVSVNLRNRKTNL